MKSTGTGEHYNYKIWISNWFQVNVMLNQISCMFARWRNRFTQFPKRMISIEGGKTKTTILTTDFLQVKYSANILR